MAFTYPFETNFLHTETFGTLAYVDEGKHDEVLLFIHGLGNYLASWTQNIKALSAKYRCIALDLPGNGLSSKGNFNFTIQFYTESVLALLNHLNIKKYSLAGHSMGGQIAMTIALQNPLAIEKLVLCAPAGFEYFSALEISLFQNSLVFGSSFYSDESLLEMALRESFQHYSAKAVHMFAELANIIKQSKGAQYKKMINESAIAMLNEPVYDRMAEISAPTLVLFGENDRMIPNKLFHPQLTAAKLAKHASAKIPKSSLKVLPATGHFLHIEKADLVNEEIIDFLKN